MERECNYLLGLLCNMALLRQDNNRGCYLIRELVHQSEKGGFPKDSATPLKNGPCWDREDWEEFGKRTIEASKNGCAIQEEVQKRVGDITADKYKKGEILP